MQKLAREFGFSYLRNALPNSVPVAGTPIVSTTAISNVIDGERNGIRFVAFDCRFGSGKGSFRRTVIAALAPKEIFGAMPLEPDLVTQQIDGWTLQFEPRRMGFAFNQVMDVEELEARFGAIAR